MSFYPVMLDLSGKDCLVVGGGRVALRKVTGLLRADALVTVIASHFNPHFSLLAKRITMVTRSFSETDIQKKYSLIIGATDTPAINTAISRKAAILGIPCNIVDQPELCSFIVPAIVNRGNITIAVSTNAASPRLSRYIKKKIADIIGTEYSQLASYMAEIRIRARSLLSDPQYRCLFWKELFDIDPMEFIQLYGWEKFCARTDQLINKFRQKQDIHE
ncbi:MAG: bifunctional precorrin-2 dehydrogenase/sirohydrochlorin ferrochelatase [Fibrobacter sp.]|nr:bifunctional precorrin-2 dehydrogenase/sirohydrochlorin ferrochelatase [Fibrobacter sp.]